MDTAANTTEGTLTDDLVKVKVILDVVSVGQVELLGVELDSKALIRLVILAILHQGLEVLPAELDKLFWLLSHDLLDEVLEDSRECIWYIDLLGGENPHLTHV